MPASQAHIHSGVPLGATLTANGATFRVWAPKAREVYIAFNHPSKTPFVKQDAALLEQHGDYWTGFFPGAADGTKYRFYVVGEGGEGFKRDPYARELEFDNYPDCNCIIRDPNAYVWQDGGFKTPSFNDLIIYQFHIGVYYAKDDSGKDIRRGRVAKILDAVDRIGYFADLGINAIMPLPFQEFQSENSLGYNGTDLFSPEMDYCVRKSELAPYLARVNRLLKEKGRPELNKEQLTGQTNQLKVFVDLCHLHGIAVIADVVYNHGGGPFDDQSMYFFDRQQGGDNDRSLYFTRDGHAGGLVFAFWKEEVRQFLIDNGASLLREYHLDGLRYDQVTVMDDHGGWFFAQALTGTLRYIKPEAVQIAEYWAGERWKGVAAPPAGMGFDIGYSDLLRQSLRVTLAEVAGGSEAHVNLDRVRDALYMTFNAERRWTVFQCVENHDLLDYNHGDRQPRISALADSSNSRSWYARSRSKAITGLLLTAPGVPMIFMGQEFLEDKYWTDWLGRPELLIYWEGLEGGDKDMSDQHRFTRDLMWLRRKHPALRGEGLNVFHVNNSARVIAFHRWLPGVGRDVVVVVSLNESTFYDSSYHLGLPQGGHWHEVFNSDIYDRYFNPNCQGNPGGLTASGPPTDGLPTSTTITLPANSVLVFARDGGDF